MKSTYHKQVETINAAAAFFATLGYQVDTTFHTNHNSMSVTIYFTDITLKPSIKKYLKCYAEDTELIIFHELPPTGNSPFYTLSLCKQPSL